MNDDLLEDEEYSESPAPLSQTTDLPRQIPRPTNLNPTSRLVIGIDFGTTFTGTFWNIYIVVTLQLTIVKGVAYAFPSSDETRLDEIEVADNWGLKMGNHHKIPSVYSYSPATADGEQQWGLSLSPDAVTMVNTKLELDVQDNKLDELELLLQVLNGTRDLDIDNVKKSQGYPDYTWKNPQDIVTDYLTKVFKQVNHSLDQRIAAHRDSLSVDIVITVPVV